MKRNWLFPAALVLIAAGAFIFRLPHLDMRPMHGDEAIQADKFRQLWEEHRWTYDPLEYHGPTLNYFTALPMWLTRAKDFAHSTEFTYRIVPVFFGSALILLLLLVGDGIGRRSALCAGVLIALSPAMVFYSRYYIQEMLLVFFTFAAIACCWRFLRGGQGTYAILAGIALGLMHATKETFILSAAAAVFAISATLAWSRLIDPAAPVSPPVGPSKIKNQRSKILWIFGALLAAVVISSLCFSAFFTNPRAIGQSYSTYLNYLHRGTAQGDHDHPFFWYFHLYYYFTYGKITFSELLIPALAMVGMLASLWKRGRTLGGYYNSFTAQVHPSPPGLVRFLAFYTLAITLVYCLVRYKTPWCGLNFHFPLILLAGVGAVALVQMSRFRYAKPIVALALVLPAAQLGFQAYRMNYQQKFYANSRANPHVYGHPGLQIFDIVQHIRDVAALTPAKDDTLVLLVSPTGDVWPLPWYLRDFPMVREPRAMTDLPPNLHPPLIVATMDAVNQVDQYLGLGDESGDAKKPLAHQYVIDHYGLRTGVPVALYIRRDLFDAYLRSRGLQP